MDIEHLAGQQPAQHVVVGAIEATVIMTTTGHTRPLLIPRLEVVVREAET